MLGKDVNSAKNGSVEDAKTGITVKKLLASTKKTGPEKQFYQEIMDLRMKILELEGKIERYFITLNTNKNEKS